LDKLFDYVDVKDFEVILQYNKNNSNFLETYLSQKLPSNVNILFDSSGGRGTVIQNIQKPFNNYTGYSGGINVENVEEICKKIVNHSNSSDVWIDLESGVRTDNNFDFVKANKIIDSVNKITNLKQNNEIF
jgi:phosphoribosylanthranilate isomerase